MTLKCIKYKVDYDSKFINKINPHVSTRSWGSFANHIKYTSNTQRINLTT